MTSAISREDVEQQIWLLLGNHRVEAWKVERLLRLVDKYAVTAARNFTVNPDDLVPPEIKLDCMICGHNLPANMFRKKAGTQRGYERRCKICRPGSKGKLYLCRQCNRRKPLREFPEMKQEQPSLAVGCNVCEKEAPESIAS